MQISLTFNKFDSSDPLKSYVNKKLSRLDKLFDSPTEANVVLSVEKLRNIAEISLKSNGLNIHAKDESDNMYATIDVLVDKVKAQIIKSKEKLRRHLTGDKENIKNADVIFEQPVEAVIETAAG